VNICFQALANHADASRMPFCASTLNSCGRTCRTSRSSEADVARASTARRTSSRSMSRDRCPRGGVMHRGCFRRARARGPRRSPPLPQARSLRSLPRGAANRTDVESRLTIRPWRRPLDPPRKRQKSDDPVSISRDQEHVLCCRYPAPHRYLSFFAKPRSAINLFLSSRRARAGVGIHDHLPRIL